MDYEYKVKLDKEKNDFYIEKFGLAAKFHRKELVEVIGRLEKQYNDFKNNTDLRDKSISSMRKGSKRLSKIIDKLRKEEFSVIYEYVRMFKELLDFKKASEQTEKEIENLKKELKIIDELCQSQKK